MDKFLFSQDRLKPKQSKSFSFDYKFTSSKDNIKECWSLIKWCPSIYEASDQCTRWSRHQNPLQFFHSFYFYLFIYFRNKDQEQHYYKWSCKKCLPPHLQNYRLQQEEKLRPTRYPAFQIHNRKSSENHRLLSAAFCYKKKNPSCHTISAWQHFYLYCISSET